MFRLNFGSFALVAALAVPLAASAQTTPVPATGIPAVGLPAGQHEAHRNHHHHKSFAHALRGLNLSDAQKQQISVIMKTARAKTPNGTTADPQARRANMLEVRRQIDGVLTPAQRAQLKANLSRERQEMKRDRAPAPVASPQ